MGSVTVEGSGPGNGRFRQVRYRRPRFEDFRRDLTRCQTRVGKGGCDEEGASTGSRREYSTYLTLVTEGVSWEVDDVLPVRATFPESFSVKNKTEVSSVGQGRVSGSGSQSSHG